MKKRLLGFLSNYTKLDERVLKYYIELVNLRFLSTDFLDYYVRSYKLSNFVNWLTDKGLLIKVRNGYTVSPPVLLIIRELTRLSDKLKEISGLSINAVKDSIKRIESEIFQTEVSKKVDEARFIEDYKSRLNELMSMISKSLMKLEEWIRDYTDSRKKLGNTIENRVRRIDDLNNHVHGMRAKIEGLENTIIEKTNTLSVRIKDFESKCSSVSEDINSVKSNVKALIDSIFAQIKMVLNDILPQLSNINEGAKGSIERLNIDKRDLLKELEALSTELNAKANETKDLLLELEKNIDEIIGNEREKALIMMKETLDMMSEEILKEFDRRLKEIIDTVDKKSVMYVTELREITNNLKNGIEDAINKQEGLIKGFFKNIDEYLSEKSSKLSDIEEKLEAEMNEIIRIHESLLERTNLTLSNIDKILDNQIKSFEEHVTVHKLNIETEKEHLINKIQEILSNNRKEFSAIFSEIFDRLKGSIGRLEDIFNLKVRQIYKSLNELKKQGESKLMKISLDSVIINMEKVIGKISSNLQLITDLTNLLNEIDKKISNRINKVISLDFSPDIEELNSLLVDLEEDKKRSVINLFMRNKQIYINALDVIKKEVQKDISDLVSKLDDKVKILNEETNKLEAIVDELEKSLNRSFIEAYNSVITEYVDLLYEGTKESIIQMIYDGQSIIDNERNRLEQVWKSDLSGTNEGLREIINRLEDYNKRIMGLLDSAYMVLIDAAKKEFLGFKDNLINKINNVIHNYKEEISIIMDKLDGFLDPLKQYLSETSDSLGTEINQSINQILDSVKDYIIKINDFEESAINAVFSLKTSLIAELNRVIDQIKELEKIDIENHVGVFNKTMDKVHDEIMKSTINVTQAVINILKESISGLVGDLKKSYSDYIDSIIDPIIRDLSKQIKDLESYSDKLIKFREAFNENKNNLMSGVDKFFVDITDILDQAKVTLSELKETNKYFSDNYEAMIKSLKEFLISGSEIVKELLDSVKGISEVKSNLDESVNEIRSYLEESYEKIDTINEKKKMLISLLDKYYESLVRPLNYLRSITSRFEKEYMKKIKKSEASLAKELIGLIDFGNTLMEFTRSYWAKINGVGELIYGRDIILEYINSIMNKADVNLILMIPNDLNEELWDAISIRGINGKVVIYTNKKNLTVSNAIKGIKVERIKEDIPFLVMVSGNNRALIIDKKGRYAFEIVDKGIISEIILSWIKGKYAKKIRFL